MPVDAEQGRSSAAWLCCFACHGVTLESAVEGLAVSSGSPLASAAAGLLIAAGSPVTTLTAPSAVSYAAALLFCRSARGEPPCAAPEGVATASAAAAAAAAFSRMLCSTVAGALSSTAAASGSCAIAVSATAVAGQGRVHPCAGLGCSGQLTGGDQPACTFVPRIGQDVWDLFCCRHCEVPPVRHVQQSTHLLPVLTLLNLLITTTDHRADGTKHGTKRLPQARTCGNQPADHRITEHHSRRHSSPSLRQVAPGVFGRCCTSGVRAPSGDTTSHAPEGLTSSCMSAGCPMRVLLH